MRAVEAPAFSRGECHVVLDRELKPDAWQTGDPFFDWPGPLTPDEQKIQWRRYHLPFDLDLWHAAPKTQWIKAMTDERGNKR